MSPTLTTPMSAAVYEAAHSATIERLHRLAADSDDPNVLIALAANPNLGRAEQIALANNECGDMRANPDDALSTGHAVLLAREDLQLFPARVILENNNPTTLAAVSANLASPMVQEAARISHVVAYRQLAANL